ncbi:hypothetical protein HYH03_016728 [Edaphochlamys debaryana]|uniref:Uncharacterized protein n=1 Tax=Edaphochlamys debaryana TaxID=47281 RepID=A0A835XJB7_9CHLO|nr:hypothetical protein HYH03_016728 [Edaphochlamys debaryana]|eukprot:KAG2484499.1 hypothetical protein HYH03_016728 [Edaphochlamys debaryana]
MRCETPTRMARPKAKSSSKQLLIPQFASQGASSASRESDPGASATFNELALNLEMSALHAELSASSPGSPPFASLTSEPVDKVAGAEPAAGPAPTFTVSLEVCPSFAEQRGKPVFFDRHATLQRVHFEQSSTLENMAEGDEEAGEGDEDDAANARGSAMQVKSTSVASTSAPSYFPSWDISKSVIWGMAEEGLQRVMQAEAEAKAALVSKGHRGWAAVKSMSKVIGLARRPLGLGNSSPLRSAGSQPAPSGHSTAAFAAGLAAATGSGVAMGAVEELALAGVGAATSSLGLVATAPLLMTGAGVGFNRLQSLVGRTATNAAADIVLGPGACEEQRSVLKARLRAVVCGASVAFFVYNTFISHDSLGSIDFQADFATSLKTTLDVITTGPSVLENCRELLQIGLTVGLGVAQRSNS